MLLSEPNVHIRDVVAVVDSFIFRFADKFDQEKKDCDNIDTYLEFDFLFFSLLNLLHECDFNTV